MSVILCHCVGPCVGTIQAFATAVQPSVSS